MATDCSHPEIVTVFLLQSCHVISEASIHLNKETGSNIVDGKERKLANDHDQFGVFQQNVWQGRNQMYTKHTKPLFNISIEACTLSLKKRSA